MFKIQNSLFNIQYSKYSFLLLVILIIHIFPQELLSQNCPEDGIPSDEYAARRKALLMKTDTNSAVVMKAKDASGEYDLMHYRQDLNFLYLTGINQPGIYLLMSKDGFDLDGIVKKTVFFVPAYSEINDKRGNYCNETDTVLNVGNSGKFSTKCLVRFH